MGTAFKHAQQVIYSAIQLGIDGQRRFATLMKQPPEPTQAMKSLGELPDFEEIR